MDACKRAFVIVLLALAMREDAASEGMRILTFVPGVAHGALTVVLDLGSSPPPAQLLVNGRAACRVTAVRQTCVVDLGPAPRVTLLELVRSDGSGQVVEQARRWVNKPSDARSEVIVRSDCTRARGPCTLKFSWSHESAAAPRELTVTLDGAKIHQGQPRDVLVPEAEGNAARIVSVELVFQDGERATRTLLLGSGISSAVDAPLNAIPIRRDGPGAPDPAHPTTLGGRVVHTVEPGEMEVLFVVAPSAVAKLQALTGAAQRPFNRNAGRMRKLLAGVSHVVFFSTVATRGVFSSAAEVSDRIYRVQGFECTPRRGYLDGTLSLPCVDSTLLAGERYRFAATLASAAFIRGAVPRRRVVVAVLGDDEPTPDESPFGAADVRSYLSDIFVPLRVWRLGRAAGAEWPRGRRITTVGDLVRGWEALRADLEAQTLCWIAEDLDPAAFRLGPADTGLALVGRGDAGSAADSGVASAEPDSLPEEDEAPGARARPEGTRASVVASQEVVLANLDASVTDRSGRPVRGLSAADFELFIGGRRVPILNFSEISAPPAGSALPASPDAPPPPRTKRRIALFVDRLTIGDANRSRLFFQALEDFVTRAVGPGDEVTLDTYDTDLTVRVPFTSDLAAIHRALEALAKESARRPSTIAGTVSGARDEIAQFEGDRAASVGRRGGDTNSAPPQAQPLQTADPDLVADARFLANEEWLRTRRKVAAIRSVLAELGRLEGRRVLVIASHRLSRNPGLEFFLSRRLAPEGVVTPESLEFDAEELLSSLARTANGYRVTLHALCPEAGGDFGLSFAERTTPTLPGQAPGRRALAIDANEGAGLHLAVDGTGGFVGLGAEGAPSVFSRMLQDLDSYDSFAFEPPRAGPNRKIELRARKPGLVVRTRDTYVERSFAERTVDRVVSNLFGPVTSPRFPLAARVISVSAAGKKGLRIAFEVRIPAASLAILPAAGGRRARITAFLALLDGGDVTTPAPVTKEFTLPENGASDAAAHFTYTAEVVTSSTSPLISIGILDEATREAGFERIEVGASRTP